MRKSRNNAPPSTRGSNRDLSPSRNRASRQLAPVSQDAFVRGAAGRDRVEQEIQKQKERHARTMSPLRFWLPIGGQAEIMVLDDSPDFFVYEHELYHKEASRPQDRFERHLCMKEYANCPVCERTGKDSYYVLFLSIIDFSGYTNKNGDLVDWSRKLLAVKGAQQKVFLRRFEKEQSLRGAVFTMSRDAEKTSSIGSNIEFEEFEDIRPGDYLKEWIDKEGKSHKEDHSLIFHYESLFVEPDPASLRRAMGMPSAAGSAEEYQETVGSGDDDEWDAWDNHIVGDVSEDDPVDDRSSSDISEVYADAEDVAAPEQEPVSAYPEKHRPRRRKSAPEPLVEEERPRRANRSNRDSGRAGRTRR